MREPEKQFTPKHIDYALSAEHHPPMYLIHKFWARKPHNVVSKYIEAYSQPGEVVLDPFCGSGVTPLEALKLGRKAIAVDVDPFATFLTRMTGIQVDTKRVEEVFLDLEKAVKPDIDKLYVTDCPKCGKEAQIRHIVFKNNQPMTIFYDCLRCGESSEKPFDKTDGERATAIEAMAVPFWYPDNELVWNSRVNVPKGMKVSDLFSRRNLIALSLLYHSLEQIQDEVCRDSMKLVFSSMLTQASKLLVFTKTSGPSWKVRGFWIPPNRYEMYIWRYFENRYEKFLAGKEDSNASVGPYFRPETIKILQGSALDMSEIPDSSVHYVFTDPPYGDSVPYLELDYMWSSWLGFKANFDDEVVISDSPARDRNFEMYYKMLARAFREVFRVLVPGRWLTLTFHNTDIQIYNAILKAVILAGFDLEKIVYQPPAHISAKAQLAPYGSAVGDYYIRLRKPEIETPTLDDSQIGQDRFERVVVQEVKKTIAKRGEPTPFGVILNSYADIFKELKSQGYRFSSTEGLDEILKKHIGDEFVLLPVKDKRGKERGRLWWFKDPRTVPFIESVPLDERVEETVINVLNSRVKVSFDEILQELFVRFPNALTPSSQTVIQVLKNYGRPTKDRKWILSASVQKRHLEHGKMVDAAARIGLRLGYQVWVASNEQADLDKTLRANLVSRLDLPLPLETVKRIGEVDVLWLHDGRVSCALEVENTTTITSAIVRVSDIPNDGLTRVIVIPEERASLLRKKIATPAIRQWLVGHPWHFVYYDDLQSFHTSRKKGRKPFDDILKPLSYEGIPLGEQEVLVDE